MALNPESLALLKQKLGMIPGTDIGVSQDVLENDPEITLDTPHTANEVAGNARMKEMLGLGPSALMKQQQADLDAQDTAVNQARIATNPEVKAQTDLAQQNKLALAHAQPGGLDVETAKNDAAKATLDQKQEQVRRLLQGGGSGQSQNPPGAEWKPAVNAAGDVSFSQSSMPALVQRAHAQLGDALNKTNSTLAEAERLYPGITQAAGATDQTTTAPGWSDFLLGNAGKYGGAKDMVGAANDRMKYSLGMPTPFANLAQEASFGNLEQMAGQLPGVRGLATITPLFKEHQSRWGKETPLATVQRLMHMKSIMADSLANMEHGGANEPTGQTLDPWAAPPTADELGAR